MLLFKQVPQLQKYLDTLRENNRNIGFVPTMGALHDGHLSLIRLSKQGSDFTLCSIFVNPTQFNEASDLDKYPRTIEKDVEMLIGAGCDALFLPDVNEMYPGGSQQAETYSFGDLETVMEGEHRPGHFAGVGQVIKRFLDIVNPDQMYMGQKDFQQFAIVGDLLRQLESKTELVMGETRREPDGLAMSSRNMRLTPEERNIAPLIHQTLTAAKGKVKTHSPEQIKQEAIRQLDIPEFTLDYFEIADATTLQPITSFENTKSAVACTAVFLGKVRLIDNILLY